MFKVGDRVRRIKCSNTERVPVGACGTVVDLEGSDKAPWTLVVVQWDSGVNLGGNYPDCLEPITETPVAFRKGDARFHALLREIGDLHDKKQADYGRETDCFANVRASADFAIEPWIGTMVRANDKMRRIQKYAQSKNLSNENVEDSFMDLAVYSLIALILFRESQACTK